MLLLRICGMYLESGCAACSHLWNHVVDIQTTTLQRRSTSLAVCSDNHPPLAHHLALLSWVLRRLSALNSLQAGKVQAVNYRLYHEILSMAKR